MDIISEFITPGIFSPLFLTVSAWYTSPRPSQTTSVFLSLPRGQVALCFVCPNPSHVDLFVF